ncbi:MAG TPA: trypsin-like peptidase domain-containing protein [Candidatus Binatia bacterium]
MAQDEVRDLVVKIHTTRREPDLTRPWTKQNPVSVSGSGIVIEGKRILTNAHVVQNASQIYVQPNQSAEKLAARVVIVAEAIDLAILSIDDDAFFDKRAFLPFADELPRVKDAVSVYGFPTGGTELSVTEGIVSRIEFTGYYQFTMGLRIQVDAALNPGNSGGPVVSRGKLIGIVFSNIPNAQSIGYVIPIEEIRLFLDDAADGVYDGKPQLHDRFQTVENSALRQRLGLAKGTGGLMVAELFRDASKTPLKEWDVVTAIGGQPIDNDGKVSVRYDLRLSALYLVQKHAKNDMLDVNVIRAGLPMRLSVPVERQRELVVPYLKNRSPRYFIYGPLVFCAASQEYIDKMGNQWELFHTRAGNPLIIRRFDKPAFVGEEMVVVCAPMLPHPIAKGYDDPNSYVVGEVDGIPIKNLKHFVEVLRDGKSPDVTIKFARMTNRNRENLVFDRSALLAATDDILKDFGIRYPFSEDLRPVWEVAQKVR